ncbi:MAG TPA: class I adenylate-forming enzyme family protein [Hyphomonas sp.]|nr:class I adenylate-forming enzyme family protein [Hyphomonas sp.]
MTFEIVPPLFHDFVRLNGKWYPDKPAIITEDGTLSWGELDRRSSQVANGLLDRGIGKGASVAILMSNCTEYVEIMYGVLKAGAVIVPLNLAVNEDGLVRMIGDSAAQAIFYTPDQFERLKNAAFDGVEPFAIVVGGAAGAVPYDAWRDAQAANPPKVSIGEDDPCNIIYSSGTTGLPKGIKHTYRRRVQSMYELSLAHRYHFAAVSICPIGLYSNIAWASLFCALIVGGTCVVRSKFDVEDWLDCVETHGVTHTFMVPIQFQRILDAPAFRPERVASLEAVISGGAPLFQDLKERVVNEFRCAVIELYGLTEGFMTTLQPEEAQGRLTSVGKPVRGHDYILVDDGERPVPWGGTGEICVRSVHWMVEYHNRPEATEEIKYYDPEGVLWLRTGDIGRTDEEGYLYITDRKKDMIVSGGQNIFPVDIEAIMVKHPDVSEVAVIGIPHATWGETPLALVVLRPGANADGAADIAAWTNERVGKRQRISGVEIREDLPRNPNGKVLKRLLREDYK